MVSEHRAVSVKRGLSFIFTVMTWVTIAPAVAIGLGLTAVVAFFYLHLELSGLVVVMVIGGKSVV